MPNEPLISVIVPIYKVEKYLNKCITSITQQTYSNLEIILVDDGSPDNCPEMCDEWAKNDSRIVVIHKDNGGLSDARNAGLKIASGEFIAFVDSDDYVDSQYISLLFEACLNNNAEISACDVCFFNEDETPNVDNSAVSFEMYSSQDAINTILHGKGFRAVAWNKLFQRELLEGEHFPLNKFREDEFFTYKILAKAKRLAFVNKCLYFYLQRSSSIMNTISIKHLDALEAYYERLGFLKHNYQELYVFEKSQFCKSCVGFYKLDHLIDKTQKRLYRKIIVDYRKKIKFAFRDIVNYSFKDLIYILGSRYFIAVLCLILKSRGVKN